MNSYDKSNILVVDDNPAFIAGCKDLLEDAGYRVHMAVDGKKAIQLARQISLDLILLDVIMPIMDGFDTCKNIKEKGCCRDIPIIFMSGLTEPFDKTKGFSLGAVDFITKPFESQELLARVRTHITIGRLQKELRGTNAELEQRVAARSRELSQVNQSLLAEIEERKQTEKALMRSQKQLRDLHVQLTELEEAEKQNLARELHDQVGQNLTVMGINLNLVLNQLSDDSLHRVKGCIKDTIDIASETAGSIRDVMAALRPQVLDDFGLKAALELEAKRFSGRTNVRTLVAGHDFSPRLPDGMETAFFRIAQEALTNVAKHSCAKKATICLEQMDGWVRLSIADDGSGFDPGKLIIQHPSGWGLITMRERIQAYGGSMRISSTPGQGTRVKVSIAESRIYGIEPKETSTVEWRK